MTEADYDYFMVFQLLDSGERERLDIEEGEMQSILHPEEVFVIVKEEIRRIFIWKGAKSPVRKRFISSRVAGGLQEELVKEANFHRCKIVSVDQGDEVVEFLQAFNLESMEVEDRLQDMRYVRNVERDAAGGMGEVVDSTSGTSEAEEEEYYSPALEELKRKGVDVEAEMTAPQNNKTTTKPKKATTSRSTRPKREPRPRRKTGTSSKIDKGSLIKTVLDTEVPSDYQRQNLIIGEELYGAVSKTTNVFGENVEKTNWELISSVPEGIFLLKDYIFRIYFNPDEGIIKAVEILKDETKSKMEKSNLEMPESGGKLSKQILDLDSPEGYKRINLIEGHHLYGATTKSVNVFGEEQEEIAWDLIDSIPKELITLDDHLFRVFFDSEKETVPGIEVLKKGKEKNNPGTSTNSNPKKKESEENGSSKRRNLPKIPSGEN
ncbi:MAG: hypothetical protein BAJALOKI2v1_50005 [Promethearchaeota archaeon]|nr:MAG: hypothetical protein BAJALOKI2v1_50005 [Candidatus Lokiarchaeota archaeon]